MNHDAAVFFDASLSTLVNVILEEFGAELLARSLIIRDTSGRLRFVSSEPAPSPEIRARLRDRLVGALGGYANGDRVLAFRDEFGVEKLLEDPNAFPLQEGGVRFRFLDRRIVGSNWIDSPRRESGAPPRIVFASLKGGVGRSTALALTAADLARRNRNVLAIDLDLEAPGLGDLLLDEERLPNFGTLDYLVENGIQGVTALQLADFLGTSHLTDGGGRVDVLPALGRSSIENPGNTLAKISRAMIEDIDEDGRAISLSEQISTMIGRFSASNPYDVVLIDSRAGLAELAAPSMLALGANVLLFGTAQQQTLRDFAALFATLRMLAERDRSLGGRAEWRLLFKAVHAKWNFDEQAAARYRDELYELFAENVYDAEAAEPEDVIAFDIDDREAPHWPLTIPFTPSLLDFDPLVQPGALRPAFYEQWYRPFLDGIDSIIRDSEPRGIEPGDRDA